MTPYPEARRFQRSGTLQSWNLHVTRCSEGSQRAGSREADSVQVSSNHVITVPTLAMRSWMARWSWPGRKSPRLMGVPQWQAATPLVRGRVEDGTRLLL